MDEPIPTNERARLLLEMAHEASGCIACALSQSRTKVVFGDGNPCSPLMLVGEGPGAHEDATGIPFVGPAGKLLDECLREAGMLRKHICITNIVKCRAVRLEGNRVMNRPPTAEEFGVCVPLWLERQIAIVRPAVILCVRAPSANALIHPNFRITQERGKWCECQYARYVMAAFHPAYILRMDGDTRKQARQSLIEDMIAARDKAKSVKNEPRMTLF